MPPKRGTKRATSPDEETKSRPSVKRSKSSTNSDVAGYPWTNKGIPDTLTFTPSEEKIRISAWNVNDRPTDPLLAKKYPHQYWNIAAKKGYDSSANIASGAPKLDQDDVKGRLVTLEFEKCWVIGTYVPNAGEGLKNMDRKVAWQVAFEAHLRNLDAIKPVIWAGDLNVAPTAKDLRNDKSNWNKTAGYTEQETSAFKRALAGPPAEPLTKAAITESTEIAHITSVEGEATEVTKTVKANVESSAQGRAGPMIDIWRRLHPDDEHYTYFSYRFNARLKGMGWRIDHFVTSERFFPKVAACEIRNEIWGASDHCPIVMDFEGPL
ncbi:hypothetical protein BN14_01995 [Rhizoctonia solani AG-1 IB]|uniref:Endonuclease/exonuclease/phosphatase domain-containing protein n=1 Tax=Thanatephorus cucumeris (strain AG1-IB / isolate 7/3/14) TaxID=1108050 RepID=M5BM70_THACB|nr:hypothetical protein BN14_01995 [Rhizoctonia solani AG-1 IB]